MASHPIRGGVARYPALLSGRHPVWAWTCYRCDRDDVDALTGEDFGPNAAFSWSDAMQMAAEHVQRHRAKVEAFRRMHDFP
jgi:hypothetical protein